MSDAGTPTSVNQPGDNIQCVQADLSAAKKKAILAAVVSVVLCTVDVITLLIDLFTSWNTPLWFAMLLVLVMLPTVWAASCFTGIVLAIRGKLKVVQELTEGY